MKVIYIIGPFRASTAWGIAQNVRRAEELGLTVAGMGAMPLIPHANTAHFHGLFHDQFWLDGTAELCRRCDAAITVPGYQCSEGSRGEVQLMQDLGRPVFHHANDLAKWLVQTEGGL